VRTRTLGWSLAAITAASAILSFRANSDWDYPEDAGPAIDALIHGRIHGFFTANPPPLMGPVSLIFRAPFAALSLFTEAPGYHFYNDAYRFGIFPCLFVAGLLGLYLANIMREHGQPSLAQFAMAGLCVVNPVSLKALDAGHPEEILGATLCVAAMLAGLRRRPVLALILLVLAVGTKQWAVVAIVPVTLTLTTAELKRSARVTAGLAALLIVPFVIVAPGVVWSVTHQVADIRNASILPSNIWWEFRTPHGVPDWLGVIAHPLLIAICVGVALLLARRVRADLWGRALPLLALVMLLRCLLDPVDTAYYHVPFLMALIAADAVQGRFKATLVATAALFAMNQYATGYSQVNEFYLLWAPLFAVYLAGRTYGLDWAVLLRTRAVRAPA
jgi:hypothetical protein